MERIKRINRTDLMRISMILAGSAVYACGVNLFIVSAKLYNGGLLGLAQIFRTLLQETLGFDPGFDYAGIIAFLLNIPVMLLTYKTIGKEVIFKTFFCLAFQTILLSVIPVTPLIDDSLTACIIGGILCGAGTGMVLTNGGSSGGTDLIGMYFTKKNIGSVGRIAIYINIFVYAIAFTIMADVNRIIYTLIFTVISNLTLDRMHSQNINCEVLIISKHDDAEIQNAIILEMRRGVSYWEGYGAFTGDNSRILYIVVSKYELPLLKKIVKRIDPHAFVAVKNGINVLGNFEKRL